MALNCKFLIASTNIVVVARREVTIEFVAVLIWLMLENDNPNANTMV